MKKVLKWLGIALGALLGLLLVVILAAYIRAGMKFSRTYDIPRDIVPIPTDPESIALGRHWAAVQCADCHGHDMGGKLMVDDPTLGRAYAPNLTTGEGGAAGEMTDEELVMAIRHGMDHDGTSLVLMPSEAYYYFSDRDLGAIIAYLKDLPPIDKEWDEPQFTFLAQVMIGLGLFDNEFRAAVIDHDAPWPAPRPGVTVDYGRYLVQVSGCNTCHGANLAGGKHPDPNGPFSPNLTRGGHLGTWTAEDFLTAFRTGRGIDQRWMSVEGYGQMTDDELHAMWLFLQSLPALETNTR